jgi:hypothetical protein
MNVRTGAAGRVVPEPRWLSTIWTPTPSTKVNLAGTPPHINPARACTTPEGIERERTTDGEIDGSAHLALAGGMEALSDLSGKTRDKLHRIAGPETVATLWYYLRAQRRSPSNEQRRATLKPTYPLDTSITEQLSRYQLQYQNMETSNEHSPELPRRLCFAKIAGLVHQGDIGSQADQASEEETEDKER